MRLILTPFDHIAIFNFVGLLTHVLPEVSNQPLELPGFRENLPRGALLRRNSNWSSFLWPVRFWPN